MSASNTPRPGQIASISTIAAHSGGGNGSVGALHSEVDAFMVASAQIETVLSQNRVNCQRLKQEITALQSRHEESMRIAGSKLRETEAREAEARDAVVALQATERKLASRIEGLEERYANLRSELERVQQHSEAMRVSAVQATENRLGLEVQATERKMAAQIQGLQERIARTQADLDQARRHAAEIRAMAQAKLDAFSQREEKFKSMILAHRAREAELGANLASIKESFERAQNENTLYKNSWTQILQNEREAQGFLKRKEELELRVHTLEERNLALITEARERIDTLEKNVKDLESRLSTTCQEHKATQATLAATQASFAEAEKKVEQVRTSAQAKISALTRELAQAKSELARERAERAEALASSEEVIARLEEELLVAQASSTSNPGESAWEQDAEVKIEALTDAFDDAVQARMALQEERDLLWAELEQTRRASASPVEIAEPKEKATTLSIS